LQWADIKDRCFFSFDDIYLTFKEVQVDDNARYFASLGTVTVVENGAS